jgi:hypothetical protein
MCGNCTVAIMARIETNKEFLRKIAEETKSEYMLSRATDEEIKVIFEILINLKLIDWLPNEERLIRRSKLITNQIAKSKRKWTVKSLKKLFLKHYKTIVFVLRLLLDKLVDESICAILNYE